VAQRKFSETPPMSRLAQRDRS